ncbi:(2Fe-2S)-binding protein [Litoribacter ruber]|uniref:(2Fe-2S)-binding protein n=1 Tax=Litoribacter ruber TaxID=702568 RepID=A0AAP2G185_9BACT|nr:MULTISPECIES: 2Fe-2S iron-sulfur cluster-binding protein [Litoribacter]MBS9524194.1 (2Fe-2S)-binding protein [Litoribacter alkaliphilus]MBT0810007.1 (2Fe-2S)-binding protein [Litoribacter ruber]
MPKIIIENMNFREIDVPKPDYKVIEIIHENYIDWMHACGKKGRCTSCKMIVSDGMENLTPMNDKEQFFAEKGRLKVNERLSCQAKIMGGTLAIRVAEENKFPHIEYSE